MIARLNAQFLKVAFSFHKADHLSPLQHVRIDRHPINGILVSASDSNSAIVIHDPAGRLASDHFWVRYQPSLIKGIKKSTQQIEIRKIGEEEVIILSTGERIPQEHVTTGSPDLMPLFNAVSQRAIVYSGSLGFNSVTFNDRRLSLFSNAASALGKDLLRLAPSGDHQSDPWVIQLAPNAIGLLGQIQMNVAPNLSPEWLTTAIRTEQPEAIAA
ncbi:hypothetical protein [Synechococcus elongatus]|uniref:hypothetical protein n=1 Tax=Synechococcus elongatus TaxID=32046 RepID=UPI0030D4DD0C